MQDEIRNRIKLTQDQLDAAAALDDHGYGFVEYLLDRANSGDKNSIDGLMSWHGKRKNDFPSEEKIAAHDAARYIEIE